MQGLDVTNIFSFNVIQNHDIYQLYDILEEDLVLAVLTIVNTIAMYAHSCIFNLISE